MYKGYETLSTPRGGTKDEKISTFKKYQTTLHCQHLKGRTKDVKLSTLKRGIENM